MLFVRRRCLAIAFVALAFCACGLTARVSAAPPAPSAEFRAAKREFQQKSKSRVAADRIAAIKKLDDVAGRDAAELIWQTVLDDAVPEVRATAAALLASWRSKPDVAQAMFTELTRATRRSGMDIRMMGLLRALAGADNGDLQKQVLSYLDEHLGTPQANQFQIHALLDELGVQADAEALRAVALFARARYFERNFGYRRCVMQAAMQIPGDDTITLLIDQLPNLKGLVQYDTIMHLIRVTGENYRDDAAGWKAWWIASRGKPRKDEPPVSEPYATNRGYYGIPIGAKRVVFTIDVSGSMRGAKVEAAKRELIEAIKDLPENVFFGVVPFAGVVSSWSPELRPADGKNKEYAIQYILAQETRNGTASYDALEASFALEPEAIYFVSDGAPVGGKISVPDEIVTAVSQANRLRRISIHTVGIGTKDPSQPLLARFMRNLAQPNWGEFREVDQ